MCIATKCYRYAVAKKWSLKRLFTNSYSLKTQKWISPRKECIHDLLVVRVNFKKNRAKIHSKRKDVSYTWSEKSPFGVDNFHSIPWKNHSNYEWVTYTPFSDWVSLFCFQKVEFVSHYNLHGKRKIWAQVLPSFLV